MKLNKSIALIGLIAGLLSPSSLAAQEVVNFNSLNTSIKMQPEISKNEMSMISNQKEVDKKIKREYNQEVYNFNKPYVKVDPYKFNKLCALVMFETDMPAKLRVEIMGDVPIVNTYSEYVAHHEIPIIGLYPGRENQVKLTVEYENKKREEKIIEIQTEALPEDFPAITVDYIEKNKNTSSLTYALGTAKAVKYYYWFDQNGEVRFLVEQEFAAESRFTDNQTILINPRGLTTRGKVEGYSNGIVEVNYLGRVINYYKVPYEVHHDFSELPNGNIILATSSQDRYVEDSVIEIDRLTGQIVDEWDFKEIIDVTREGFIGLGPKNEDWLHINSVFYDATDDSIVISGRHQGVIKIDKDTREIKWILSDPANWTDEYKKYLLRPIGDNFEYPYAQHSAVMTQDGKLMLYDNGNNRSLNPEHALKAEDNYSRAVSYVINKDNMTIQQVWQYGKERGAQLFTHYIGSVQELDNKNAYICFGGINNNNKGLSKIIEIDNESKKVISETTIENGHTYRAKQFDINGERKRYRLINEDIGDIKYDHNYYNDLLKNTINGDHGLKFYFYIENNSNDTIICQNQPLKVEMKVKDSQGNEIKELEKNYLHTRNIQSKDKEEVYFTVNTDNLGNGKYNVEVTVTKQGSESQGRIVEQLAFELNR